MWVTLVDYKFTSPSINISQLELDSTCTSVIHYSLHYNPGLSAETVKHNYPDQSQGSLSLGTQIQSPGYFSRLDQPSLNCSVTFYVALGYHPWLKHSDCLQHHLELTCPSIVKFLWLPINEWLKLKTHPGYFHPAESFKPQFLLGSGGARL